MNRNYNEKVLERNKMAYKVPTKNGYTTGELFGGATPSDIKTIFKTKKPKNLFAKQRPLDNPYEVWESPDGSFETRVLKKNQIDDDKPYASWFTATKSPYTFGSWEYGDMYVKDIKKSMVKVK